MGGRRVRLSRALCSVVGEVLRGSHTSLDALFINSGAPGEPPALAHDSKWKEWLFRAGQDPSVDSLAVLGNVLEEFMDLTPTEGTLEYDGWKKKRERVEHTLEENGLRYYRFGRVLPQGGGQPLETLDTVEVRQSSPSMPTKVEEFLEMIARGLRRAMHPLTHRRKGTQSLSFSSEYGCPRPIACPSAAVDQRHQTGGVHAKLRWFEYPYGLLVARASHCPRDQDST
jgi:hypothetical protein